MADGRINGIYATVQPHSSDLQDVHVQVAAVFSALSELQSPTLTQRSGPTVSAGTADAATGAATERDRGGTGWPI